VVLVVHVLVLSILQELLELVAEVPRMHLVKPIQAAVAAEEMQKQQQD
jgi:hypothetical protein